MPSVAIDYWLNDRRSTLEEVRAFCSSRKWARIREGYLVSEDSTFQIEHVGVSILVWVVEHACPVKL